MWGRLEEMAGGRELIFSLTFAGVEEEDILRAGSESSNGREWMRIKKVLFIKSAWWVNCYA
jgi:hypothetical protein